MKKIFLTVILLTITSGLFAGDFRIGLKADPSFSWIKPDGVEPLEKTGIRMGFIYGLITEIKFGDNYSLVTGLNISNIGGNLTYNDSILPIIDDNDSVLNYVQVSAQRIYRLKYVTLPMSIRMMTREIGYFKYYGQFGLELGMRIGAKANDEYKSIGESELPFNTSIEGEEIEDEIKLFRAGLVVGLGVEYNISGNTALVMGIKFNNGFSNVFPKKVNKVNYKIDGEAPEAYSKAITVSFGIMF